MTVRHKNNRDIVYAKELTYLQAIIKYGELVKAGKNGEKIVIVEDNH